MESNLDLRKEKVKEWLENNLYLLLLMIFAVAIRIYYFIKLGQQPIWWDEGDYLAIAKVWALNQPTPEWWSHFTGMRPLLLPLIWTAMFKIGLGEMSLRFFTLLLPSIGSIYLSYLLGKSLYNKEVGLISGLMLSVYWGHLFYTYRLLTDVPAVFFGLLTLYFFWEYYIKREKLSGLYLAALFGVIAFSIRFPYCLVLITCAVYLLFIKKHKAFTDKGLWKGALATLIFLSPYLIYFIVNKFAAIRFYFGDTAVTVHQPMALYTFPLLFSLLHNFWLLAFTLGIISLLPILLYFDMIWKQKTREFNSDLLVILWLIVHLVFYVIIIRGSTDRWLMMLLPAMFIISAKGILWITELANKYHKILGLVVLLVLLFGGAYQNLIHANSLIMEKSKSYNEIKLGGEWLKENTPEESKIITASIVQNQYYSERESYDFTYNTSSMPSGCIDLYGHTVENETCQRASELLFEQKVSIINPDYFVISAFEPVFTPAWAYNYGPSHNLTLVQAYTNQNQPILLIYQF